MTSGYIVSQSSKILASLCADSKSGVLCEQLYRVEWAHTCVILRPISTNLFQKWREVQVPDERIVLACQADIEYMEEEIKNSNNDEEREGYRLVQQRHRDRIADIEKKSSEPIVIDECLEIKPSIILPAGTFVRPPTFNFDIMWCPNVAPAFATKHPYSKVVEVKDARVDAICVHDGKLCALSGDTQTVLFIDKFGAVTRRMRLTGADSIDPCKMMCHNNRVYVTDKSVDSVWIFALDDGKLMDQWTVEQPCAVIAIDGFIAVMSDDFEVRVNIIDANGETVETEGSDGIDDPHDICQWDDHLLLANGSGSSIQHIEMEVGDNGSWRHYVAYDFFKFDGEGKRPLPHPVGICTRDGTHIFVVDSSTKCLHVLNGDKYEGTIPSPQREGGAFEDPRDVQVIGDVLYVLDCGRIEILYNAV